MAEFVVNNPLIQEQDAQLGTDNKLTLRITIGDGPTKSIMFDPALYVSDCLKIINEKQAERTGVELDISDHGLYQTNPNPTKCRWLMNDKTLRYHDVHSFDEFEFKKKHRPLRVQLMDGSRKVVLVDDSIIVEDMAEYVGRKLDIKNPEEFSLKQIESADGEWLNPHQTLNEQGITEEETLLLKKKYFYHDANIDANDPMTLNLLYEQIREDVVEGRLPVTEAEACDLAALQLQIVLGQHDPSLHKAKTLNVKQFVPKEFVKTKNIAKKILENHRMLGSMNMMDAKFRFIQYSRTLETYGITVWTVKEPIKNKKGKNTRKFQPVLLGVSRSHVHRLDPITKENLDGSPVVITKLRRWAPSKDSLTLDYGDHFDEYYTVITSEGEAISALIAGYIDIILRQKRDRSRGDDDDDVQRAVVEEMVAPRQAHATARTRGALRQINRQNVASTALTQPQRLGGSAAGGRGGVQRAGGFIPNDPGLQAGNTPELNTEITVNTMTRELEDAVSAIFEKPPLDDAALMAADEGSEGDDAELDDKAKNARERRKLRNLQGARDMLNDVLGDLADATSDAVSAAAVRNPSAAKRTVLLTSARRIATLTTELDVAARRQAIVADGDVDEADAKVEAIKEKMQEFLEQAKIVTLELEGGATNGDEARKLVKAAADIAEELSNLKAAAGVGDAKPRVLETVDASSDKLQSAAAGVGESLATALELVDDAGKKKELEGAQMLILDQAEQVRAAVLLAGSDVTDPAVQDRLDAQTKELNANVLSMLSLADMGGLDDDDLMSLKDAASLLTDSIANLVGDIKTSAENVDRTAEITTAGEEIEALLAASSAADSDARTVANAKQAVPAVLKLVQLAQLEAENETDPGLRDQLLELSELLASKISDLNACLGTDGKPDGDEVNRLVNAIGDDTRRVLSARKTNRALRTLATAAKASSLATVGLVTAVNEMGDNRNVSAKRKAVAACDPADSVNEAVHDAVQLFHAQPSSPAYQKELLLAVKAATQPTSRLILAAKAAAGGCLEWGKDEEIESAAAATGEAMRKLVEALRAAEVTCWALAVEEASEKVTDAKEDLNDAAAAVAARTLTKPDFTFDAQTAQDNITDITADVEEAVAALAAVVQEGGSEGFGAATLNVAEQVAMLGSAARAVAGHAEDPDIQARNITAATAAVDSVLKLIACARTAVEAPSREGVVDELTEAAERVSASLEGVREALPGVGDCLAVSSALRDAHDRINLGALPPVDEGATLGSLQEDLLASTRALSSALSRLVGGANGSPSDLSEAAVTVGALTQPLIEAALMAAAATTLDAAKSTIVGSVKAATAAIASTLDAARAVGTDPTDLDNPKALSESATATISALDQLVAALASAAPGESECDEAAAAIAASRDKLDASSLPPPADGGDFSDFLAALVASANELGASITALKDAAESNHEAVAGQAAEGARLMDVLAERAALAAVNVPGSSGGGSGGALNSAATREQADIVYASIAELASAGSDPKLIVKASANIAKAAMALASTAKEGAPGVDDAETRAAIEAAANAVSERTAKLVSAAKKAASKPEPKRLNTLADRAATVQEMTAALMLVLGGLGGDDDSVAFNMRNELLDAAKSVANALSSLVGSSKVIVSNPNDVASKSLVRSSAKQADAALDQLMAAAKGAAPGQKECEEALAEAGNAIGDIDSAIMASSVGTLRVTPGATPDSARSALLAVVKDLTSATKKIGSGAKSDVEKLGKAAAAMAVALPQFTAAVKDVAGTRPDAADGREILAASQALVADMVPMLRAAKVAGGAGSKDEVKAVTEAQKIVVASTQALMGHLATDTSAAEEVAGAISAVEEATTVLASAPAPEPGMTYSDYQAEVTQRGRELATALAALTSAAKKNPEALGDAAKDAAAVMPKLTLAALNASKFSSDADSLLDAARAVAEATARMIGQVPAVQANPKDSDAVSALTSLSSSAVAPAISGLFNASAAPARGEQDTEDAITAMEAASNELTAAELMATTRQLKPKTKGDVYGNYQDTIVDQARASAAIIGELIAAGKGDSPAELAEKSREAAGIVSNLTLVIRDAAATLPEIDAQCDLLAAARALADALANTVGDCLELNANPKDKALGKAVKKDTKAVAAAIQALVEKASSAEAAATLGVRALDAATAAVNASLGELEADSAPTTAATAENVEESAREMAKISVKLLLSAKSSQAEVAESAELVASAIVALLAQCKAAGAGASPEARASFNASAKRVADANLEVFSILSAAGGSTKNDRKAHKALMGCSKSIADAVAELVQSASFLANPEEAGDDEATAMTEREMLSAAGAIEDAAKKLNKLRPPRKKDRTDPNELSFEEQAVEACKAIAAATQSLVKSATVAQRDIVRAGKAAEGARYVGDSTWSSGLISAAQAVAAECDQLVRVADTVVKGEQTPLALKAAGTGVQSATIHLVTAAQVKGDPNAKSQVRLKKSAKTVRQATGALLDAVENTMASSAAAAEDEDEDVELADGNVAANAQMMEARLKMLKLQADLEKARRDMGNLNKKRFKRKG